MRYEKTKTAANNVNVPVHKNQKHVILKNRNQPNLLSKLKWFEDLKIKYIKVKNKMPPNKPKDTMFHCSLCV